MGSTRLPCKIMKMINNKTVLDYVLDRVELSKKIDEVILATTKSKQDDIVEEYAKKRGTPYFRGSEDDVLGRYYHTAKKFGGEIIVRVTGDDPLIDPNIIDQVIECHLKSNANYTSNNLVRTYPLGLDVEVFDFTSLEKAFTCATNNYDREHVTPYLYKHPEIFKTQNLEAKGKLNRPNIRITLDTKEDLKLIKRIVSHFRNVSFKAEEIIDFLDENPFLMELNKNVKQKSQ